jgi:hypothetical protein
MVIASDMSALLVCRYEVEKLTASQRLDLNLEKGRMRDELQVCEVLVGLASRA